MIEGYIAIGAGILLFAVGSTMHKVSKRALRLSKEQTYSKAAHRAMMAADIYTEHGMVKSRRGGEVEPKCKKSDTYYESLL